MFPWGMLSQEQVQGNQGEWLHVHYILIDFVGPSMISWLMTVNHRWTAAYSDMLRESFLSLMVLCHRSHQSKLSWDQELFSGSLCYDVVKRRWFWADATILQEQTAHIPCTKACYTAVRLLAGIAGIYVCLSRCALPLSSGKNGCPFIWARQKHRSSKLPALQQI